MTITARMQALLGEGTTSEGGNEVWMDLALFIRVLEFAREDSHDDIDLHDVAEMAAKLTKDKSKALSMGDYEKLMPKGHTKNSGGQKAD